MREILFRGKDTLGHWLYGGFHLWETRQPCVMDDKLKPEEIKHIIIQNSFADWNMPRTMQPYIVIPETVGQYTGLTDKNGTKIFEGDIIKSDNGRVSAISVVQYGKFEPKMFYDLIEDYVRPRPKEKLYGLFAKSKSGEDMFLSECSHLIEVIGNIHDNPELLRGDNNA